MENLNAYLLYKENKYLLKKDNDLYRLLTESEFAPFKENVKRLTKCGISEIHETSVTSLYKGEISGNACFSETVSFFTKDEILKLPINVGEMFYVRDMLNGATNINLYLRFRDGKLVTACSRVKINPFIAFFKHLHTVNTHRRLVRRGCFKVGLYRQGLTHDLSKYSFEEFSVGVKYYQGMRSPNVAERIDKGYSSAWLHHKGRNKHHIEYWSEYSAETGNLLELIEMPKKYFVEQVMDRIAASKVYRGKTYNDSAPMEYFMTREAGVKMAPKNKEDLVFILTMLSEKGEKETFKYIKNVYLKEK